MRDYVKDDWRAVLEGNGGLKGLNGQLVQVGGDATTGRGQVVLKAVGGKQ